MMIDCKVPNILLLSCLRHWMHDITLSLSSRLQKKLLESTRDIRVTSAKMAVKELPSSDMPHHRLLGWMENIDAVFVLVASESDKIVIDL